MVDDMEQNSNLHRQYEGNIKLLKSKIIIFKV